jgi:His Kinase A (phospho-acceptor) domain
MASLGQLTAGIAHEIKNPLNFVNNFASLSVDLLDELKQTAAPGLAILDEARRSEVENCRISWRAILADAPQRQPPILGSDTFNLQPERGIERLRRRRAQLSERSPARSRPRPRSGRSRMLRAEGAHRQSDCDRRVQQPTEPSWRDSSSITSKRMSGAHSGPPIMRTATTCRIVRHR